MEIKTSNITQIIPEWWDVIHHFGDSPNIIIGRTQKLNQTFKWVLPENPSPLQMASQRIESRISRREYLPNGTQGDAGVKEIK